MVVFAVGPNMRMRRTCGVAAFVLDWSIPLATLNLGDIAYDSFQVYAVTRQCLCGQQVRAAYIAPSTSHLISAPL